jgi:hypothetical protein
MGTVRACVRVSASGRDSCTWRYSPFNMSRRHLQTNGTEREKKIILKNGCRAVWLSYS